MQPDDVYPLDGSHFLQEPEEQTIARKKHKAQTLEALPILKELVERLDERVKFYEKTTSISAEAREDQEKFFIWHNTHSLMADTLKSEKEYIESLMEDYAKHR